MEARALRIMLPELSYEEALVKCNLKTIEIIDIECVLDHESCLYFSHACPYKSAMFEFD